jgi:hypothetical protein
MSPVHVLDLLCRALERELIYNYDLLFIFMLLFVTELPIQIRTEQVLQLPSPPALSVHFLENTMAVRSIGVSS